MGGGVRVLKGSGRSTVRGFQGLELKFRIHQALGDGPFRVLEMGLSGLGASIIIRVASSVSESMTESPCQLFCSSVPEPAALHDPLSLPCSRRFSSGVEGPKTKPLNRETPNHDRLQQSLCRPEGCEYFWLRGSSSCLVRCQFKCWCCGVDCL